jgi:hypothetical protein
VPDRDLARRRLIQAATIGVPAYTEGLRLLFEGLRAFAADDPDDTEIRRLLDKVGAYTAACDWTAPYTTYWADRPDNPSLQRHVGLPPGGGLDWTAMTLKIPATSEALRVLYLTPPGDPESAADDALQAAAELQSGGVPVEIEYEIADSTSAILNSLYRFRPHVVHFSSHGEHTALDMGSTGPGAVRGVTTDDFVRAVGRLPTPPQLVVVDGHRSTDELGDLLAAVPVAIGTGDQISAHAATSFAAELYGTFAAGGSVESAYNFALSNPSMGEIGHASMPLLVHNPGLDPAGVHLIEGPGLPTIGDLPAL